MTLNFDNYAAKGNEIINHLSFELDLPRDQAGRVMKAVLHGIRDRICPDENLNLLAQLPMFLKGVYVDGWKPGKSNRSQPHLRQFLDEIRLATRDGAPSGLGNDQLAKIRLQGVFKVLGHYIIPGELSDAIDGLPNTIKEFVQNAFDEAHIY
ncbi:MAG: DUF2267 domain-containing protein [Saprospiraceae bacterium]|nr:DUF2267 domain-containing protein [Saprospiraceae bacterium]